MRSDIDSLWTRGSASLPWVQEGEGRSALRPWTRGSASLPCVQEGEGRSALRPWTRGSASLPGILRCFSAIAGIAAAYR